MAELTKITRKLCFVLGIYLLTSFSGGFAVSAQSGFECDGQCITCTYESHSVTSNSIVKDSIAPVIVKMATDSVVLSQENYTSAKISAAPEEVVVEEVVEEAKAPKTPSRFIANFPAFALKTNMLYDAATILNIKVEAPITPRWSVGLEWIFPWWHNINSTYAVEAGIGDGEVRYWFQDRSQRGMLEGWFAGVYGAGGYYDLQRKQDGNQGELYSVGLTGGYAMPISKLFKIEFCLGVGYMHTDYRHYDIKRNPDDYRDATLIYRYTAKTSWWGPTKAEVSLVFTINSKNYNRKGR